MSQNFLISMSSATSLQLVTTWDYLHDTLRDTTPRPDHLAEHANCSQCWNIRFLKSATDGDLENVQRCLGRGADPESVDEEGGIAGRHSSSPSYATHSNALHLALLFNNENEHVVHYLSKHHRSLVDGVNSWNETPLFNLARSQKISEFSWNCLISAGGAFDHWSNFGFNALHFLADERQNVSYLQKAIDHLGKQSQVLEKTLDCMPTVLHDMIRSYLWPSTAKDPRFLETAISHFNWEGVQLLKTQIDLTLKNQSGTTLKESVEKFEKEFLERENTKKIRPCALL